MAITAVTPASASSLAAGDSFSFTIDDTYTSMLIRVQTSTALVSAYDGSSGGAQAGYTVSVVDNGDGTHTFTVARDAGWDVSPQLIYVTEDETGSTATTSLSYTITTNEATYPQGTVPYNAVNSSIDHGGLAGLADDDHTQYHNDTRGDARYYQQSEVDALLAAATLDDVINATTPDNDVTVPGSIILRDGGSNLNPLKIVQTYAGVGTKALYITGHDSASYTLYIDNGTDSDDVLLTPSQLRFGGANAAAAYIGKSTVSSASALGATYIIGAGNTGTGDAGDIFLNPGQATGGGTDGILYLCWGPGTYIVAGAQIKQLEDSAAASATAAFGQWYVKDDAPNTPHFADDTGTDFSLVRSTNSSSDYAIPTGITGTGFRVSNNPTLLYNSGQLKVASATSSLFIYERTSSATNEGGFGQYWVKNGAPNKPYFADDLGNELPLTLRQIRVLAKYDTSTTNTWRIYDKAGWPFDSLWSVSGGTGSTPTVSSCWDHMHMQVNTDHTAKVLRVRVIWSANTAPATAQTVEFFLQAHYPSDAMVTAGTAVNIASGSDTNYASVVDKRIIDLTINSAYISGGELIPWARITSGDTTIDINVSWLIEYI